MPLRVAVQSLPEKLPTVDAVGLAYPVQLADAAAALSRGLSCLIECAKEMVPFVCHNLRLRLRNTGFSCLFIDGRPAPEDRPGPLTPGELGQMSARLRAAVRGALEKRVVVLPHLDLMAGGAGVLGAEARETAALLHENPDLVWLGFRDPALLLPRLIEEAAVCRFRLHGVERSRLGHLITQAEGRMFGLQVNLGALHQRVSGVNAVRLRKLLSALDREDVPVDPAGALAELRRLTLAGGLAVPETTFDDIGGYEPVKRRLREEVLQLLDRGDAAETVAGRERSEALLPRGLIFTGPPGVGKRLFARALAHVLGAALLETTAAELKSRYVGGSEENLRQLFWKARQAAPALILFHDIGSFAGPPGRAAGSVEPSMLQQLQQEMDGLPRGELVLVVGTSRSRTDLDPALFRPGRFELVLEVAAPDAADRRDILRRLDRDLDLRLTPEALDRAVELSGGGPDAPPYHGERLHALGRALARRRLREGQAGPTTPADVEAALALL